MDLPMRWKTYVGLDGEEITREEALALMDDEAACRVGQDQVVSQRHGAVWRLSTMFMPINFRSWTDGPPISWETLVAFEPTDGREGWSIMWLYRSREDATDGHAHALTLARHRLNSRDDFLHRWKLRMETGLVR